MYSGKPFGSCFWTAAIAAAAVWATSASTSFASKGDIQRAAAGDPALLSVAIYEW
jgi:hypothetical protein